VGYVTSSAVVETIPFENLTHINYAFLLPNGDGTLKDIPGSWTLQRIVKEAANLNVQVLISVGGWGLEAEFESLAADPKSRNLFVKNLVEVVRDYNLAGADIDWEYPDRDSRENFLALMAELRAALPADKLLTAAVVALGSNAEGIPAASFKYMDFVNIMVYDGLEHASLNYAQNALDYWSSRGLPKEKMVLGVPFYSRPVAVPYRELVRSNPAAAFLDEIEYDGVLVSYNGVPTIQQKTRIALHRASGMMIWTLEYDTLESETSLLNAIINTIHNP